MSRIQKGDVAGADHRIEATVAEHRRLVCRSVRRLTGRVDDVPAGERYPADDHRVSPAAENNDAGTAHGRQRVMAQWADDGDESFHRDRFEDETAGQQLHTCTTGVAQVSNPPSNDVEPG